MSTLDIAVTVLHLAFAGIWTGSVVFVAHAVVPAAAAGELNAAPFGAIVGKVTNVSRLSALVLFLTGGHMAGAGYTVERLTGTGRGHLVLTMLALWFVLAALVEVAASRARSGTDRDKVREPARESRRLFQAAALVAILLLVDAGMLASGWI